jgi:succinate dehydrogenase / fumarate reductase cytochrome b subunit
MMKRYQNYPGILGWFYGGKLNFERVLFLLHRITGIGLIFYLLVHIIVVGFRAYSPELWDKIMKAISGHYNGHYNPIIYFLEWLLLVAVIFHMMNGLRLIFLELGFFIGKPERPIYPYRTSIDYQRMFSWIIMIIAGIFIIWSLFAFYNPLGR